MKLNKKITVADLIVHINTQKARQKKLCGGKFANLSVLGDHNFKIPDSICLTTKAYDLFMEHNKLRDFIALELSRKDLNNMRWEEMWDASLRISSAFLRAEMPFEIKTALKEILLSFSENDKIDDQFITPLVVRSSSTTEDSGEFSFAGIHESVVDVRGYENLIQAVLKVWASLWSDGALLYAGDLGLNPFESSMAVVIQPLISGRVSGVLFTQDPVKKSNLKKDCSSMILEVVQGLNESLVSGQTEPCRYSFFDATWNCPANTFGKDFLNSLQLQQLQKIGQSLEKIFNTPQDVEWTLMADQNEPVLLQARPITTLSENPDKKRSRPWYLSLKRSFENLQALLLEIEETILPGMAKEADLLSQMNLVGLSYEKINKEINRRRKLVEHWKDIYWDKLIPFAHGMRLFGEIYNDRVKPLDPYEFMTLLTGENLLGLLRNKLLKILAQMDIPSNNEIYNQLNNTDEKIINLDLSTLKPKDLLSMGLKSLLNLGCKLFPGGGSNGISAKESLLEMVTLYKKNKEFQSSPKKQFDRQNLLQAYLDSFKPDEKEFALNLLELARKSYRYRDDDNLYLSRIEEELNRAENLIKNKDHQVKTSSKKKGAKKEKNSNSKDIFESSGWSGRSRQLRGQPAGPGFCTGIARVVKSRKDLLDFKKGEILICQALDPTMTFVIPFAAGVAESRGGMLIHGAIVAREYGIPCVTGIPELDETVHTGIRVSIDGNLGILYIGSNRIN